MKIAAEASDHSPKAVAASSVVERIGDVGRERDFDSEPMRQGRCRPRRVDKQDRRNFRSPKLSSRSRSI